MHHCLTISEILSNIFSYIYVDDPNINPNPSHPTLARLARTCRAFQEPALDLLWQSLPGLEPLVYCIPTLVRHHTIVNPMCAGIDHVALPASTDEDDLTRMFQLARKVKNLNRLTYPPNEDEYAIPYHLYGLLLALKPPESVLLPNLRRLTIPFDDFRSPAYIPRLISGQALTEISVEGHFNLGVPAKCWTPLGIFLDGQGEKLQRLTIHVKDEYCDKMNLGPPASWVTRLSSFPKLQELDISSLVLDGPSFVKLASLTQLKSLKVNLTDLHGQTSFQDHEKPFPSLRHLTVTVLDANPLNDLLEAWDSIDLESLIIWRDGEDVEWQLDPLLSTLSKTLSLTRLRSLQLCNSTDRLYTDPYNQGTSNVTKETVEFLFPFRNLRQLLINFGGRVTLVDGVLKDMAVAWPCLTQFELYERETRVPSLITPAGLLAFVNALPELSQLTLRFQATLDVLPSLQDISPARQLREIDVCTSDTDIIGTKDLSGFMKSAFPCLDKINFGWKYLDDRIGEEFSVRAETAERMEEMRISLRCWRHVRNLLGLSKSH